MKISALVLALAGCLVAGQSYAQGPAPYVRPNPNPNNPYSRPIFSPYLNLARTNNPFVNAGINYAGVVRPEFQLYSDVGSLQRQVSQVQTDLVSTGEQNVFPATGHATQFMNFGHYYQGGAGAPGRRPGASTVTPTIPHGNLPSAGSLAPRKR